MMHDVRLRRPDPRGWVRRRGLLLVVAAVMAGLVVNAWVQAGGRAMAVLFLAAVGFIAAVALPGYTSTALVVRHSTNPRRQIEARSVRAQIEAEETTR